MAGRISLKGSSGQDCEKSYNSVSIGMICGWIGCGMLDKERTQK